MPGSLLHCWSLYYSLSLSSAFLGISKTQFFSGTLFLLLIIHSYCSISAQLYKAVQTLICVCVCVCRYTAVVMPVLYNTTHRSRKRVFVMITTVWVLAFAVSCPLLFGFNTTGQVNNILTSSSCLRASEWSYAGSQTECKAGRHSVVMKFRVKIQSTSHLGSVGGHEMQPGMWFKGALHQFSMPDSFF